MVLKYLMLAAALAPLAAQAQGGAQSTYRCVGKDGKKYYGSLIPQQCFGQLVEELSSQGTVVRRIDPEGDEKKRVAKEAQAAQKRDDDALAKEALRRNQALLATYTSDKDIEEARGRALTDNEKAIKDIERRIAEIKNRQAAHDKEMEFYKEGATKPGDDKKGKPGAPAAQAKGESKVPSKLVQDMKNTEAELTAQENLLALKKKEVETINMKYDDDKKRFADLTKRR